ncbi:Lsr2 family DNA-binding protein [Streptomyces roseochromogenus]|uniref:Lsr2 DNA-binding domain-containing protein n=1 Tax=Streptomyces roseochromogenus subsp. oscitans DS 12.976 TaxID=1352936 RepID=V6JZE3_STRRC|nr:histone-like nucleoid-structuring protein Lsr2 [Streptomyces roseochromogenus]EST24511.1 hypothetical protein M878_30560 [Streptomyces roseochromogenus subsp. oscitans DS 12.976]
MTIAALRRLLDEIDQQGGPEAARENRLHLSDESPEHMTATTEPLPVGRLLKWADEQPDRDVRDQAARARVALASLRKRYDTDQELTAITTEAEQLKQRLAELLARKEELMPVKPKKRRASPSYEAATVRAWARENSIPCPPLGRVPKAVVDAWLAATRVSTAS